MASCPPVSADIFRDACYTRHVRQEEEKEEDGKEGEKEDKEDKGEEEEGEGVCVSFRQDESALQQHFA